MTTATIVDRSAYVRELVDAAPPLSDAQLDRLARLLAPSASGHGGCGDGE